VNSISRGGRHGYGGYGYGYQHGPRDRRQHPRDKLVAAGVTDAAESDTTERFVEAAMARPNGSNGGSHTEHPEVAGVATTGPPRVEVAERRGGAPGPGEPEWRPKRTLRDRLRRRLT
jgi:hypothetical protein